MNKRNAFLALLVLLVVVGAVWYTRDSKGSKKQEASSATFGTYSYECDEHVAFTMTPAADMSTIAVAPSGTGSYPPRVTLVNQNATSGVKYVGGGVVFTARGETVTLGEGDSAINCSPVPSQDMAPFNFGD